MVTGGWLIVIFLIAIAILLITIIKFKVNAFIALLVTTIGTGLMVRMPVSDISKVIGNGFGNTLGSIGVIIGLGVMLGRFLYEAGGIEVIADTFLKRFNGSKSRIAVAMAGFITGIPVFGDVVHIMYAPMVRVISKKTKVSIVSLCCATVCATVATGAMVIPTPNPMAVAENLQLDYGVFFLYAALAGLFGTIVGGLGYGRFLDWQDRKNHHEYAFEDIEDFEKESRTSTAGRKVPGFGVAVSILLVPIMLILFGSFGPMILPEGGTLVKILNFVGDKNIAMLIGVIYAALVSLPYLQKPVGDVMNDAAGQVGLVLLITGSGGAFGKMLQSTGIADFIATSLSQFHIPVLVLCFIIAQILRCAQGSTGVALITTSSMFAPLIAASGISPVLCGIAICAGGIGLSLPNDSGFWAINRFYKISVEDTIRAWTIGGFITGVAALVFVCILSVFQAHLPGLL